MSTQLQKTEVSNNVTDLPEVTILNFRQEKQDNKKVKDYDYILNCIIENTEYNHPLKIPKEIKNLNFKN